MRVQLQNGQVKFVCELMKVIGSRSKSQEQTAWNVISPPLALMRAYLLLQWRQVHFSHSGYDAPCLRTEGDA